MKIVIGAVTGIIFALSWIIFIDGQIMSSKFVGTHLIPCLIATAGAVAMNFASIKDVQTKTAAKVWMFVCVTVMTICIGAAVFIVTEDSTQYPVLLQTILMMFASFLFFIGRADRLEPFS
jgi:hypothetical protein